MAHGACMVCAQPLITLLTCSLTDNWLFIVHPKRSIASGESLKYSTGQNSVHAFGYNSAESQPIWMKSRALWTHCLRLALADLGRDLSSSDSLRGSRNFFMSGKWRTISPISRRINFTTFKHNNVDRWGGKTFETECWKFYYEESLFQRNAKNAYKIFRSCDLRPS